MCGICGVYQFNGDPVDKDLLRRMSLVIRHRGPDGAGSYVSGDIGLGHRRLSIIDIDGGAQPITNEDCTLHLIFNGEIYNFVELRKELENKGHVFSTHSDTEVILHGYEEWGLDCVNRFNGIFAFALWDEKARQLFLARDHLGVKPLYYTTIDRRFLFGSEIKCLLEDPECPREVDCQALAQLFTLRYVLSPDTLFSGIKKLPAGHLMVVNSKGIKIDRYWRWKPTIRQNFNERNLVDEYRALIEDAVRLQMRSDVPVGLWLSSGIDSGTLLAIMSRQVGSVHTFTIGFEGGDHFNETTDAQRMALRFGADHSEMIVGFNDYERYFEQHFWNLEEPLADENDAAFYFVSLISSKKVKVALTGQGADEPWAGYHRYLGVKLSELYSRLPSFLTNNLCRYLSENKVKHERLSRGVFSLHEKDILKRLVKIYSLYTPQMRRRLFQPWINEQLSPDSREAEQAIRRLQVDVADLDPLTQMTYIDTRANLTDDLLTIADKTSMANSIEARVPFLDYRIVEFAESLPPRLKLHHLQGKYLHKKAIEKWLPKDIVYRRKKGFTNPVDQWLRSTMCRYVDDCLLDENAAVNRYFNKDYIKEIVARHQIDGYNFKRQIYLLIQFELWHQQFLSAKTRRMSRF